MLVSDHDGQSLQCDSLEGAAYTTYEINRAKLQILGRLSSAVLNVIDTKS